MRWASQLPSLTTLDRAYALCVKMEKVRPRQAQGVLSRQGPLRSLFLREEGHLHYTFHRPQPKLAGKEGRVAHQPSSSSGSSRKEPRLRQSHMEVLRGPRGVGVSPSGESIPALTERSQLDSKSRAGTVRGGGKLKEKWKNKRTRHTVARANPLYCHGLARFPHFMGFDLHLR